MRRHASRYAAARAARKGPGAATPEPEVVEPAAIPASAPVVEPIVDVPVIPPDVVAFPDVVDVVERALVELDRAPALGGLSLTFPTSSNVVSAELDAGTGIVTVAFKNGSTARYANVTPDLMAAWRDAESPGKWHHANLRSKPALHPVVLDPTPAA